MCKCLSSLQRSSFSVWQKSRLSISITGQTLTIQDGLFLTCLIISSHRLVSKMRERERERERCKVKERNLLVDIIFRFKQVVDHCLAKQRNHHSFSSLYLPLFSLSCSLPFTPPYLTPCLLPGQSIREGQEKSHQNLYGYMVSALIRTRHSLPVQDDKLRHLFWALQELNKV